LGAEISERGVDDLPTHGDEAGRVQGVVEPGEQRLDRAGLGQLLAEQPDRARVRHPVGQAETEEAHERQAIIDQELGTLVRQVVGGLDDQHLEHHHRVERRPTATRTIRIGQCASQLGTEQLDIHRTRKRQQLITERRQTRKSVVNLKEPGLLRHRTTSSTQAQ
jgi:hypothetical protein